MPAVLLCLRIESCREAELTRWDTLGEAREVAQWLPCGPACEFDHLIGWRTCTGRIRCEFCQADTRRNDLGAQLAAAGYHTPNSLIEVQCWPAPPDFNRPLQPRRANMCGEQIQRALDRAVAEAADRRLTPHPGGLAGRIADATAEAAEAIAAGDIDGAIGADMLAAALTDAWAAEHGAQ
jgi:hypothetical protein